KWVTGVEFLTEPERGYWELRGYSNTANPWEESRYS
ncbi:MAG: sulfite oxidase-like oxidoreductase, partial [Halobacteriota archaeon]